MDSKIHVIYILCLILLLTSSNCEQTPCDIQEDFQTVAVAKARGRIGNHIWMYMKLIAKELRYGIKGYITDDSRWILNEYFKGFEENTYPTAEKHLCGFEDYWNAFTTYLDNKVLDFYEEKSGIRIKIVKPTDRKYNHNRLRIPPEFREVALKYPLSVVDMVDSEEFMKDEPTRWKTENCKYVWEPYRGERENLKNLNKNHAFVLYPSGANPKDPDKGSLFSHPLLSDTLASKLEFKDIYVESAQKKLHQVKKSFKKAKKETIFVGIHSRRTDHLSFQVKKLAVTPLQSSYFLDAIELFREKFPSKKYNLAFIYVSDDLEWGRINIGAKKGGKNVFFIGEEEESKGPYDLALLANCNHTIQSYGSFTYYAGFFAGGYKILPEHFKRYWTPHTYKPPSLDPFENPVPRLYFGA